MTEYRVVRRPSLKKLLQSLADKDRANHVPIRVRTAEDSTAPCKTIRVVITMLSNDKAPDGLWSIEGLVIEAGRLQEISGIITYNKREVTSLLVTR